jgi:FkbM family methyltransferase
MLSRPRGGDLWLLREIMIEESYLPILSLLEKSSVRLVDVGSHIGAFTAWLAQKRNISEAFCFEPERDSHSLCKFNLRAMRQVRVFHNAIGGTARRANMWIDTLTHARSSLNRRDTSGTAEALEVGVLAFSEWLKGTEGDFDLLKMDCEGSEWEILDADPSVFARFSVVVAEIHRDPKFGNRSIAEFSVALQKQGFTRVECDKLYLGHRGRSGKAVF